MSAIYMCSVCGAYGKDCALKIGGRDQRVFAWRMFEVRGECIKGYTLDGGHQQKKRCQRNDKN